VTALRVPHHVSREALPGDRGYFFGQACAEAVAVTVATYRRLLEDAAGVGPSDLRRAGADVLGWLQPRWPALCKELEGIAAGAGQDVLELAAINARTELLAGGCSVIAHRDGSLAQTWDWHPDLAAATVTWTVHLPGGRRFTTATEAGILAKLGCNRAGLSCGLNFLACSDDGGTEGAPIHVLLRLVLERCDDIDEALALLRSAPTSASACITLAGGARAVAAELCPGGITLVEPDADGWLVHTNHFLAGPVGGHDTLALEQPGTFARRELLVRLVQGGVPPRDALATHAPAEEPVCRHADQDAAWADRRATLLAVTAVDGELCVAPGPPCSNRFVRVTGSRQEDA
jgi:isopenicillin-N N-acyltransferase like protein